MAAFAPNYAVFSLGRFLVGEGRIAVDSMGIVLSELVLCQVNAVLHATYFTGRLDTFCCDLH